MKVLTKVLLGNFKKFFFVVFLFFAVGKIYTLFGQPNDSTFSDSTSPKMKKSNTKNITTKSKINPNKIKEYIRLRIATYNVLFSRIGTAKQIGKMFAPYKFDIVGFNEAPQKKKGKDWATEVGKAMGIENPHVYVGDSSSANHKDKYKSILSITPLTLLHENILNHQIGWKPASIVGATTFIKKVPFIFYSLHIPGTGVRNGSAVQSIADFLKREYLDKKKSLKNVFLIGDFNNQIRHEPLKILTALGFTHMWCGLDYNLRKHKTWDALSKQNEGVIDHIFYHKDLKAEVVNGGIIELEKPLSDHKPVWVELKIPIFLN